MKEDGTIDAISAKYADMSAEDDTASDGTASDSSAQ